MFTSWKRVRATTLLVSLTVILSCASSSHEIAAYYVSPDKYETYSCDQLWKEFKRLNLKKTELAASLDMKASSDEEMTAVSAFLFWPAAFALGGNEAQEAEYARLKGEYDAVQKMGVEINCDLAPSKKIGARLLGANLASSPDVLKYYGEAEKEILSNSYDANLWAKALVDAEGDEGKRKARYIELRASQLYSENANLASTSSAAALGNLKSSNERIDYSGIYKSKIVYTSVPNGVEPRFYFGKNPDVQLRIDQKDNKITAVIGGDRFGNLVGTVDGRVITYEFLINVPGDSAKEGKGVWTLNEDSTSLGGNWNIKNGPFTLQGNWDLTRIE